MGMPQRLRQLPTTQLNSTQLCLASRKFLLHQLYGDKDDDKDEDKDEPSYGDGEMCHGWMEIIVLMYGACI